MKKQILSLILALCLILSLLGAAPQVSAEELTADLFYLEETTHMLITVEFTAEAPLVYFIAPNGTVYDDTAIDDGLMYRETYDNALVFRIPNASYGQWQIVYDKLSNEKLSITWAPYAEPITVESFTFEQKGDILEAQLTVSYVDNDYYDYTVYAALVDESGNVTGTKELRSSSARANRTESFNLYISDLPTYADYRLMVQVVMDDGGTEVEDSAIAEEPFSYTNDSMSEPLQGMYLEIGVDDETLLVDWTDYAVYCYGYSLVIYGDGEVIHSKTVDSDITSVKLPLPPTYSKLKVELVYVAGYNGRVSQILSREVDLTHRDAVTVEASDVTTNANVKITYDFSVFGGDVKTLVKVNDKQQQTTLSGSGTMTAALELFENQLYLYWYPEESTAFVTHKTIYYDNIAPLLVLPELTSDVRTSAGTYVLAGYTDPGCTVTVNDQTAETDEAGAFTVTLKLQPGSNHFTVTARNALGNASTQAFTVERSAMGVAEEDLEEKASVLDYLPMLLSFAMSILVMLFALIAPKNFAKRKADKGTAAAVTRLAAGIVLLLDLIAAGFALWSTCRYIADSRKLGSMEFFDTASDSVSAAYALLKQNAQYKEQMILWLCVFGGATLLGIGLLVLAGRLDKNRPTKTPENPASQPTAPAETPETPAAPAETPEAPAAPAENAEPPAGDAPETE